ncbi:MAG: hypothetical protein KGL53_09890, partial [Elusimicrobia bacterium]|nr:hypothetical protein [Elusimicrobiota bacterium]
MTRRALPLSFVLAACLAGLAAVPAAAGVPGTLRFQGRLLDPSTTDPRSETSASVVFRIYDAASGGTLLWSEGPDTVALDEGSFDATLGDSVPLSSSVFAAGGRWLELAVGGQTLSPRQPLDSAPWALRAAAADSLEPGDPDYIQNGATLQSGASFHASSGSVATTLTSYGTLYAVSDLVVKGVVRTGTGLQQITTAAGLLDASKLDPATLVPDAALDVASVTKQGPVVDAPNTLAVLDANGYVPSSRLDATLVTKQGNSFNGGTQLVQLNGSGLVPDAVIDGSSVAKLGANGRVPNVLVDGSTATKQGNSFNGPSQLLQLTAAGLVANSAVDASSAAKLSSAGLVPDSLIDSSSATLAGNGFNGANQLVRLDSNATLTAPGAGASIYSITTSSSVNVTGTGAKVRENGSDLVPKGLVMLWTGSACPAGWVEAVDFQGRIPMGNCATCTVGTQVATAMTTDGQQISHTHTSGTGTGFRTGGNLLTDSAVTNLPYV